MIPIGTKVKAELAKGFTYNGTIIGIVNPGERTASGEVNLSDEPIYRVEAHWIKFNCFERELKVVD